MASFTWRGKSEREIDETYEDSHNVKYAIDNEFNVKIKKHEVEFDPGRVQLFRVSLSPNEQKLKQMQMKSAHFHPDMMDFKDRFLVTFQQLSAPEATVLSSNHSYLVYTPQSLALWHGAQVDLPRQKGSLHVLKQFYQLYLNETIASLQPSYLLEENITTHKFMIELQD
jgi:hypothetical protein